MSVDPAAESVTGRKNGSVAWVLVVTGLAGFMAMLDNLVVIMALPAIAEDLGGGMEALEWTVSAYTLTFAVLLMLGASLGDRYGRKRMFLVGMALFTASSAAAALAPGIDELIVARAVQGVGAAIIMPLTLTLLITAVPATYRGVVLGVWGAVNGLAIAAGPLIGGSIVEHADWSWIFWLNVPIGIALVPLAAWKLRESHGANSRLDVTGTVLASIALFGIVYAMIRGNADGWTDPLILAGLIGGGALLVAFVIWELRAREPMLPMRLFRNRTFSGVNAASLLMALGNFGAIFLLSQYLQLQGYSPLEAGVRMLPWTGAPIVVAPIAGMLSDRIGGRAIVVVGLLLQGVGLGWWAQVASTDVGYAAQLGPMILNGVGMAMFYAPVANVLMGSVRPREQGVASGANNALREIGGALGVAVLTAVFAARGDLGTPQAFVDGLVPALWVGAGAVAVGAIAMLATEKSPAAPGGEVVARAGTEDTAVPAGEYAPPAPAPVGGDRR
ncbi:DHA2 family efflux MFS transporter permease subunit [Streptomyces capillispiralis]|uniref:EmrB/QacA subfamily drug resistance transporter n=1 Tax=Streptomyces capillispiralis TaxID=68182 RepID=A0A561TCC7_9ACTN|nr:DHA2 family efflux MFS transporter permease subunit [Streptomyces capillispiralis]TWF84771.1 EmrB/QacA subfamily drug resistance transporter [Streptomyces capillispiralis]GHH96124.1 MFS transporter [Streptomyces capillispiralis]